MDALSTLLVLLFLWVGNPIDTIRSEEDVRKLLSSLAAIQDEALTLASASELIGASGCDQSYLSAAGVKVWTVADVDVDGFNDLVVHVRDGRKIYPVVVYGTEAEALRVERLYFVNADPCLRASVMPGGTALVLSRFQTSYGMDTTAGVFSTFEKVIGRSDTLCYSSCGMYERPVISNAHPIRSVKFEFLGCPEICPEYTMELKPDGQLILHRQMGYNPKKANPWEQAMVSAEEAMALISHAEQLSPKDYQDAYYASGHQPHVRISFTFSDYTVKVIYDYGMSAGLGMRTLYEQFIRWHREAVWKPYPVQKR